jgi:hypothetical protein
MRRTDQAQMSKWVCQSAKRGNKSGPTRIRTENQGIMRLQVASSKTKNSINLRPQQLSGCTPGCTPPSIEPATIQVASQSDALADLLAALGRLTPEERAGLVALVGALAPVRAIIPTDRPSDG